MQYCSFDAARFGFPKPKVPVLPTLAWGDLWRTRRSVAPGTPGIGSNARFYSRGRYALLEAYRLCGAGPDRSILIPAYHCRTMLDPAIRLGAPIVLYPVTADLQPDLPGLDGCFHGAASRPAALVVSHYFGFPQELTALREWCNQREVLLIEDCSHSMVWPGMAAAVGSVGDFGIASPYKFFPAQDGGLLWARTGSRLPPRSLRRPAPVTELKALRRGLIRQTGDPGAPGTTLAPNLYPDAAPYADAVVTHDGTSDQYDVTREDVAGLRTSWWIAAHADAAAVQSLRARNYRRWVDVVSKLPHCRALYPALPANLAPYMFPLVIDFPQPHFHRLKMRGVPIWRWDDMAISACANAASYRTLLLHLPCHQSLTDAQMAWMATGVSEVLQSPPSARVPPALLRQEPGPAKAVLPDNSARP